MLRITKSSMLGYQQPILVPKPFDLMPIRGPETWPSVEHDESLLGAGVYV